MYTVLHMIYAFVYVAFVNVMTLSQVCALRDRIRALSCKTRVHAIYTFLHTVSGACNLYVLAHEVPVRMRCIPYRPILYRTVHRGTSLDVYDCTSIMRW